MVYGEQLSRFRPRVYTITFISFDFLSLILQAAGGAITSSSNDQSGIQTGVNVMLAGLGMQVASMTAFIGLCIELTWRLSKNQQNFDPAYAQLRASTTWKVFLVGMHTAPRSLC